MFPLSLSVGQLAQFSLQPKCRVKNKADEAFCHFSTLISIYAFMVKKLFISQHIIQSSFLLKITTWILIKKIFKYSILQFTRLFLIFFFSWWWGGREWSFMVSWTEHWCQSHKDLGPNPSHVTSLWLWPNYFSQSFCFLISVCLLCLLGVILKIKWTVEPHSV